MDWLDNGFCPGKNYVWFKQNLIYSIDLSQILFSFTLWIDKKALWEWKLALGESRWNIHFEEYSVNNLDFASFTANWIICKILQFSCRKEQLESKDCTAWTNLINLPNFGRIFPIQSLYFKRGTPQPAFPPFFTRRRAVPCIFGRRS